MRPKLRLQFLSQNRQQPTSLNVVCHHISAHAYRGVRPPVCAIARASLLKLVRSARLRSSRLRKHSTLTATLPAATPEHCATCTMNMFDVHVLRTFPYSVSTSISEHAMFSVHRGNAILNHWIQPVELRQILQTVAPTGGAHDACKASVAAQSHAWTLALWTCAPR